MKKPVTKWSPLFSAIVLVIIAHTSVFAQATEPEGFRFIPNKGQWAEPFEYKTELSGGEIFFNKTGLVFGFWDARQKNELMEAMHEQDKEKQASLSPFVDAHGVFADFVNPDPGMKITGGEAFSFYHNYFLGNDASHWASEVPVYKNLVYENVYKGVNMVFYTDSTHLKYDWIVQPGASPKQIKLNYRGASSIALYNGGLHIMTSVNEWIEQKPYAYQVINGEKVEVPCEFTLKNETVGFRLGKYDTGKELIIDPTMIFASYSGSARDNWGFTATYDYNDNMYGGGIVFGNNAYPGFPGSFQLNFGGGQYDVLICKFNASGNNLLYYTYLGGGAGDAPVSLVCNPNNELFILGVTGSPTYPISPGAFQPSFGGGTSVTVFSVSLSPDYGAGSDIFITRLSPNGTTLLGSTFLGGNGNDGLNVNNIGLNHNYADEFRGEIILDNNGDCYFTSSTKSSNFPLNTPFQPTLLGGQDAVICKMNANLTTMIYGSYLGGSSDDAGYSVQLNNLNQAYVTGGTGSSNFPVTPGVIKPTYGGAIDGFLTRVSATGTLMNSTYIGTSSYDQCYAVQLDGNNDPYVLGQSVGGYPVTGGVYSNPNSGQFIHKLDPALGTTGFSTVFGRGVPGQIDIVPTAFLVDVCDHIYVAGWGGNVNAAHGGGSTVGMPVTPTAYQTSTNGSDFYLMVLDDDASALMYATYFGGSISAEHVDGGTSRFDKNGIVYEAVCAGCGSNDDFPTTPGSWSQTNNSSNCNLGVFKFDVSEFSAIIDPLSATTVCVNGIVTLGNASTGGFPHQWDFGDGTFSTAGTVNHSYANPGTYVVYLEVFAPNACLASEKDSIVITVEAPPIANIQNIGPLCEGDSVQLVASGGTSYTWNSSPYLSGTTIPNPIADPPSTTDFIVNVTNNCGADADTVTVQVINVPANAGPDVTICTGQNTQLNATGGVGFQWNNPGTLSNPNISNPVATPPGSLVYIVTVTDVNGCTNTDSVSVTVDLFPQAQAGADQTICYGESYQLNATGGSTYAWSPALYLDNAAIANPVSTPTNNITYVVGASNSCGVDYDTISIRVIQVHAATIPDTIICPYTSVFLYASGGTSYLWSPAATLNVANNDTVIASPVVPTNYIIQVTDTFGCSDFDTVFVDLFPANDIELGPDVLIPFGGETQLNAQGNGIFTWTPDSFLTCSDCPDPIANPFSSTEYTVTLTDNNGCKFSDSINVFVEGSLYVPNTFTPNMDNINGIFFAYGVEIKTFTMYIFNRWGQEIFHSGSLHEGWDGTYGGAPCPIGVYVWKINYTENSGKGGQLIGHVNLLR